MKALFDRKFTDSKELREATENAKKRGVRGSDYIVIREVELSDHEFQKFCSDFLKEQPWIEKTDGGSNAAGELRCIRVKNVETDERILVNTEGYEYPRYTPLRSKSYLESGSWDSLFKMRKYKTSLMCCNSFYYLK